MVCPTVLNKYEDLPEVEVHDWNRIPGVYIFLYQDAEMSRTPLHLKCIKSGSSMVVHWCALDGAHSPGVQNFDIEHFTTEDSNVPRAYQNINELIATLDETLGKDMKVCSSNDEKLGIDVSEKKSSGIQRAQKDTLGEKSFAPEEISLVNDKSGTLEGPKQTNLKKPQIPLYGVGYEDVNPPGIPGPGFHPVPRPEGLPHQGGGMHVGPHHPMFGPGKLEINPDEGSSGSGTLPPGARWDPIAPPGMEGFRPGDFQKNKTGKPHPDMMQPGPGRTDFDSFFG